MSITIEEWTQRLKALGADGIKRAMSVPMAKLALSAEADAKRNATSMLSVRTGRLRSSISARSGYTGDAWELRLRAGGGDKDLSYARIQELGGTVRPKKGKFLAIPVGPALTGAGVAKFASARDAPGLVLVQSRGGNFLLVKAETERGPAGTSAKTGRATRGKLTSKAGEVWYVLRTSVTIPPHPYLGNALAAARLKLAPMLRASFRTAALGGA
jgi:hypothetical protein